MLGVDSDWVWHYEMTVTLPNGNKVYLHHGKAADIKKLSTSLGMCAVSGHLIGRGVGQVQDEPRMAAVGVVAAAK